MLIVTGASDNHYLTLINMINSFVNFSNNKNKLIVYNLGLEQVKWSIIQNLYKNYTNITYKIFDYSKYPEWFNIYEKPGAEKKYSPIRISGLDSHLADRYNDKCMDLSDKDVDELFLSIVKDIDKKVGK